MIMKKLMFIAAMAAFILMDVTASAQFVQSTGRFGGSSSSSAAPEALFSTVDFTYSPVTMAASSGDDSDSLEMTGISINWSQARNISNQYPVYLQYGAGLQYTWHTESDSDDDYYSFSSTTSFLTIKVPVNIAYNLMVPNTKVSIMPYVGLNANIHLLGQNNYTYEYSGSESSGSSDYFSEDDMGKNAYNRFVIGWQIGAMVSYQKFFVGIGYAGPVTNLYSDDKYKIYHEQTNLSVGIKF